MEDFIDKVANSNWQKKKEELKSISLEIMGEEEAEEFNRVVDSIPPVAWINSPVIKLTPLQESFLHTFNSEVTSDGTTRYFIPYIFEKLKDKDYPNAYRLIHIETLVKEDNNSEAI